jgi:hypothetical protein
MSLSNTARQRRSKSCLQMLTPKVSVELHARSTLTILALCCPVGHATELVALGERSVGYAIESGLGGH